MSRRRATTQRKQLKAAEEFVWIWADVVNTEDYSYGKSLECSQANVLVRLFRRFSFLNTAADLMRDHLKVCDGTESHGN